MPSLFANSMNHLRAHLNTTMVKMMFWQMPLILIFTLDPGFYVAMCWLFGHVMLMAGRWWLNVLFLALALGVLMIVEPPPTAEFFVGMLALILPLSWRPESGQTIAPVGLTPTIFLVGSVFIFHIQFFILLLVFIWLLGFLMWFSMVYAGWSLKDVQIKWGRLLGVSVLSSSAIVLIFALIPKIDGGAIPSFARTKDQVRLTSQISAEGFRSLLQDDSVAFRAFPLDEAPKNNLYWRVFTLDEQTSQGWKRGRRKANDFAKLGALDRPHHRFEIITEGHDLKWLPVLGWPAPRVYASNRITPFAEVESPKGVRRQARVAGYDDDRDSRSWAGTSRLQEAGQIGEWAEQNRRQFSSDRAFAEFLLNHFKTHYRYVLETDYTEESSSAALDEFFFEGYSGYCSFFAQAMATALRAAGIPAHVVTGYLGGEWNDFGGYWLVRNNMAHAWVEAYLDDTSWQRFDPTAVVVQGGAGGGFNVEQYVNNTEGKGQGSGGFFPRMVMWADSFNTNITRSIMQFGGSSRGSFKSRITGLDFQTLLWILGGLMVSVLLVSFVAGLIYGKSYFKVKAGVKLERQLMAVLNSPRLPTDSARRHGEGLIRYVNRLGGIYSHEIQQILHDLACRISRIRFGTTPENSPESRAIAGSISALKIKLIADNKR